MQSISISFVGSIALLIFLYLLFIIYTVYSYRKTNPPLSNSTKIFLMLLRIVAIGLLLFALFEPILTSSISKEYKPKILVLLDNSLSMKLKDAGVDRLEKYKNAIINSKIIDKQDISKFGIFDKDVKFLDKFSFDSLKFDGEITDLSKAINSINFLKNENIRTILLFTDGAYNQGHNPVFDIDKLAIPFYVVGIGDTTDPKDIYIHSIITNDITYLGNVLPINVNINYSGYNNLNTIIDFYENDKLLDSKEISLLSQTNSISSYFEYIPKQEGSIKLSFRIRGSEDEITKQNNSLSKYVKVLKNKRKISIFSGYPNPDISFLKNLLNEQSNIEFNEYIQKLGSEFYNVPSDQDIAETELFIFIAFPINSTPDVIIEKIRKQLSIGKPILFISGLNTDYNKLKKIEEFLPFNTASFQSREYQVIPDFLFNAISNPILRIDGNENDLKYWNSLSPIFKTEAFFRIKPESEILAYYKINNTPIKEPLIIIRDFQGKKSLSILGYDLYKWKLAYASEIYKGRSETKDLYSVLLNNSLKWLSVSETSRRIRIQPVKDFFTEKEPIEFIAQIYDAAFNPIENATVSIKLPIQNIEKELVFTSIGGGKYFLSIDKLPKGDYQFKGFANLNNKEIGNDNGKFSVGGLNIEFSNLRMNYQLLNALAKSTNGKIYFNENSSSVIKDIESSNTFKSTISTLKTEILLWNNYFLMIISIVLLSIEWFLRKRYGLI